MQALIIGKKETDELTKLREYAEKNILTKGAMIEMSWRGQAVGDDENRRLEIPLDYRMVYSIEERPCGTMRHISVSRAKPGQMPSPESVIMLMGALGFKAKLFNECAKVWIEGNTAVNVVEVYGTGTGDSRSDGIPRQEARVEV